MEDLFICGDCRSTHTEPADARLGHLVLCLSCALARDVDESKPELFAVLVEMAA